MLSKLCHETSREGKAGVGDSWAGPLLEVRGVGVTRGRARLLDEVDLVAEPRSWTAVVGPNGAGKSTLLRAVAGLTRHDGHVLVDGRGVERLSPRERAQEIGYAPQTPVLPEAVTSSLPCVSLRSGVGIRIVAMSSVSF